jgi:tetratricopeptide (TPR) repeat protein
MTVRKLAVLSILIILITGSDILFMVPDRQARASTLPSAERIKGERYFASAYRSALAGNISEALAALDQALECDPYLVAYYYLKAYCYYILGNYEKAIYNLELYLEVESDASFVKGFLERLREEKNYLEKSLSKGITSKAKIRETFQLNQKVKMGILSGISWEMPGRPSIKGPYLTLCDTERQQFSIFKLREKKWEIFYQGSTEGRVVRVLPLSDGSFLLVFADGKWERAVIEEDLFLEQERGDSGAYAVSDAVVTNSGELIVADRLEGRILFDRIEKKGKPRSWKPREKGFEPLSLSVYGPLLAISDRSTDTVRVLNIQTFEEMAVFEIEGHPRSVDWLSSEKVVVLTEDQKLFEISLQRENVHYFGRTFPEGWFLFRIPGNGIAFTDTRLYKCGIVVPEVDHGFMSLRFPSGLNEQNESRGSDLFVQSRIIYPLGSGRAREKNFQGVFSGALAEVSIHENRVEETMSLIDRLPEKTEEIQKLALNYRHLILDSSFHWSQEEILKLGGLALTNGIIVHILAEEGLPSLAQMRLAELTGGKVLLSMEGLLEEDKRSESFILSLRKSLKLHSGNIKGGGLFITCRAGNIKYESRIPYWEVFVKDF